MSSERTPDEHSEFSTKLFDVMNYIGYNPNIVASRKKMFTDKNAVLNSRSSEVTLIAAGSKGEGLTSCFESDYDRLNIYRDVICIFPGHDLDLPETATCFYMSDKNCHAGHFTLNLLRHGSVKFSSVEAALITNSSNEKQISSDLFTKELEKKEPLDVVGGWNRGIRTGPAVPSARGIYQRDDVFAFRCLGQQTILTEWANRHRKYNWPHPKIIEEILELEAQLVPVGCKGSDNQSMEWRVGFVPGELKLCESLNETQYKIYILLKMVNKHVLRRVCADISSYMMKNITFWIVENNPAEIFTKENLIHLLKLGFQLLTGALQNKCLPYYMIPKRNLLIGKKCLEDRDVLIEKLEEIMADCHGVIMNLPKVHEALTKYSFQELIIKGYERDKLERLELKRRYIVAWRMRPQMEVEKVDIECWSDKEYRDVHYRMYDIVWPDWKQYFDSGRPRCTLKNVMTSITKSDKFLDQYKRFARSHLDIIWPYVKEHVNGANNVSEDEIIDFLAILKVKVEIALS